MDTVAFIYTPLDAPNVLFQQTKLEQPNTNPPMMQAIREVAYAIAKKKPGWTVVLQTNRLLKVYERDEGLGSVMFDFNDNLSIKSRRITAAYPSRKKTTTKDPRKAYRIVLKYFAPLSLTERLNTATKDVRSAMYSLNASKNSDIQNAKSTLFRYMENYVEAHWGEVCSAATNAAAGNKAIVDIIQSYPKKNQESRDMQGITKALDSGAGFIVVIRGDTYYMCNRDGVNLCDYTNETLPDEYKRSIGLLKLVEDKQYIPDVGYRYATGVFFVMEK